MDTTVVKDRERRDYWSAEVFLLFCRRCSALLCDMGYRVWVVDTNNVQHRWGHVSALLSAWRDVG